MTYIWLVASLVLQTTSAAVSLSFLASKTGLLSIAHVAFVGVGAYTTAILTKTYGVPWPIAFLAALAAGAIAALIVAFPILKLRKDAAILASIGAVIVFHDLFQNVESITRGPLGIKGIPPIQWKGLFVLDETWMVAVVALTYLILLLLLFRHLQTTPLASVLHAIRERESAATTAGHRTTIRRYEIFLLTAAAAAGMGAIAASRLYYIDPSLFSLEASVMMLFMIIIGGLGRLRGAVAGALLLTLLPELLRFVDLPIAFTAQIQQALVGVAILLVMRFRPRGIFGNFTL